MDTTVHITVLVSADMGDGSKVFQARAAHLYYEGDFPSARYTRFTITAPSKRGKKERDVIADSGYRILSL